MQFANALVLNGVGRRNTQRAQMSATAEERKRAQKSAYQV